MKNIKILLNNNNLRGIIQVIYLNKNIHLILKKNHHYILNKNDHLKQQFQYNEKMISYFILGNIIYLKRSKEMIIFDSQNNSVYKYNIETKNYTNEKIDYNYVSCLTRTNMEVTENEKYIVIFGGIYKENGTTINRPKIKSIFVYDVKKKIFGKSLIYCPFSSLYKTIIICDDNRYFIMFCM